jgi:hypothetical protein
LYHVLPSDRSGGFHWKTGRSWGPFVTESFGLCRFPLKRASSTAETSDGERYSKWKRLVVFRRMEGDSLTAISLGRPSPWLVSSRDSRHTPFSVRIQAPACSGIGSVLASGGSLVEDLSYRCFGTRPGGVNRFDIGRITSDAASVASHFHR